MTDTLTFAALLIPALIVAIVCHEVAHGWVAMLLGDTTAYDRGRLTLNPIRHVDPVGTLPACVGFEPSTIGALEKTTQVPCGEKVGAESIMPSSPS